MPPLRILIAAPRPLTCLALGTLLEGEADCTVVAEARTGAEALRRFQDREPNLLLLDLATNDPGGLEVLRHLQEAPAPVRVLALSDRVSEWVVNQALDYGVDGLQTGEVKPGQVLEAVRGIGRGERGWYSPRVARYLADRVNGGSGEALSSRELAVLALLASGRRIRDIAERLHMSESTVKNYVSTARKKLGARTLAQAVARAVEWGLIPVSDEESSVFAGRP